MTEKNTGVLYACYKENAGFIAKKQPSKSLYFTMTEDIHEARLYKSKQGAARALNYRRAIHPSLTFYEVKHTETLSY